jgi:hypothetical protein
MVVLLIMTSPALPAALLLLLAAPAAPAVAPAFEGQMLFHQHIVIRIPRMPAPPRMPPPMPRPPSAAFHEKDGPKCVASDALIAATIPTDDRVDIMMRGGERLRFYVTAGHDGQVCAKRDSIRTRSGDECGIAKFRQLVPDD